MSLWVWAGIYTLAVFQFSALATTIYLHRSATHRALTLHPAMELPMRIHLWLFTGIVTREWVAVHRKHHHFTDETGDPHSPLLEGLWQILAGNPIYYRRAANDAENIRLYAKDIPERWYDRVFLDRGGWGILAGLALTMGIMGALGAHVVTALWLGLAVYFTQAVLYIGANALINGACHVLGYRNFENTATNLRWVAWLSAGEGLHNNHHQYPSAGRLSVRRTEVDLAWPVIRLLERLSLAKVKQLPQAYLRDRERFAAGSPAPAEP